MLFRRASHEVAPIPSLRDLAFCGFAPTPLPTLHTRTEWSEFGAGPSAEFCVCFRLCDCRQEGCSTNDKYFYYIWKHIHMFFSIFHPRFQTRDHKHADYLSHILAIFNEWEVAHAKLTIFGGDLCWTGAVKLLEKAIIYPKPNHHTLAKPFSTHHPLEKLCKYLWHRQSIVAHRRLTVVYSTNTTHSMWFSVRSGKRWVGLVGESKEACKLSVYSEV